MKKVKFTVEFVMHSSRNMLYNYISTSSDLSDWFADNVNNKGKDFTFTWDGEEENATLLKSKAGEKVRFQWEEDEGEDYFFEMSIMIDDLTKDVSLVITDFAEEDEIEESKLFWESKIDNLRHVIGS